MSEMFEKNMVRNLLTKRSYKYHQMPGSDPSLWAKANSSVAWSRQPYVGIVLSWSDIESQKEVLTY